ncbi:MAG: hypothetical protein PHP82_03845, partial [Candidatus ainarchaeum sp.]|nr:hypothetical protein [Candidatus ainarchaeum sp.]
KLAIIISENFSTKGKKIVIEMARQSLMNSFMTNNQEEYFYKRKYKIKTYDLDRGWRLELVPDNKYSLKDFAHDVNVLHCVSTNILAKFNMIWGGEVTKNLSFNNQSPEIEIIQGMLHIKYLIENRGKNLLVHPEDRDLDTIVFGKDYFKTFIDLQYEKSNDYNEKWFSETDKILKKFNPQYNTSFSELIIDNIANFFK